MFSLSVFTIIALNTLLVSIPEEAFVVIFSLIVMGRFDLLKLKKQNILKLSVLIIFPAILTSVLRALNMDINIILLIGIMTVSILMLAIYNVCEIKEVWKTFVCILISVASLQVFEIYIPVVLTCMNLTLKDLKSNVLLNFLITLPERGLEYLLVAVTLITRFDVFKVDVIQALVEDKKLRRITVNILGFIVIYMCIIGRMIYFNRILANLPLTLQTVYIVFLLLVPIFIVFRYWSVVYYMRRKSVYQKNKIQLLVEALRYDISKNDQRQEIKLLKVLDEIEENI